MIPCSLTTRRTSDTLPSDVSNPVAQLESVLANLSTRGKRVENAPDDLDARQVWSFTAGDTSYHLHFYPRSRSIVARLRTGNRALVEFANLQILQKSNIPAPRPISVLLGFRLAGETGDAVILESLEPGLRLDRYLFDFDARGEPIPDRRHILKQLIAILQQMGLAKVGHDRLDLSRFVLLDGRVLLHDVRGMRKDGLKLEHMLRLAHDARGLATRTDLVCAWQVLAPEAQVPESNTLTPRLWQRIIRTIFGRGAGTHFQRIHNGGWQGVFTRLAPRPLRWSRASRIVALQEDWQRAWPILLQQIESDQLSVIKRDAAGDVLRGEVILNGQPIDVVVKRPKRKRFSQYLIDLVRPARASRSWDKTWKMLIRDVPAEFPMILMERRVPILGYALDGIVVYEHVPGGKTLAKADLDEIPPDARQRFFDRAGRILRRIDDLGYAHADAKSTNWMVFEDPADGPTPVLIDLDGLRYYPWAMLGFNRLMRAMRQHPQFTPDDSLHLCKGYAPEARVTREDDAGAQPGIMPPAP